MRFSLSLFVCVCVCVCVCVRVLCVYVCMYVCMCVRVLGQTFRLKMPVSPVRGRACNPPDPRYLIEVSPLWRRNLTVLPGTNEILFSLFTVGRGSSLLRSSLSCLLSGNRPEVSLAEMLLLTLL